MRHAPALHAFKGCAYLQAILYPLPLKGDEESTAATRSPSPHAACPMLYYLLSIISWKLSIPHAIPTKETAITSRDMFAGPLSVGKSELGGGGSMQIGDTRWQSLSSGSDPNCGSIVA